MPQTFRQQTVRALLSTALAIACLHAHAQSPSAQPDTAATPAQPPFLNLQLVKAPAYPAAMLAGKQTTEVDALVRITREGKFKAVANIRSTPAVEDAEAAVRAMLPQWTFRPAFDANCEPIESEGLVRVWFDIEKDRPSVSVARVKQDTWFNNPPIALQNYPRLLEEMTERYPRSARATNSGATVVVATEVDSASGRVLKTKTTYVSLDWESPGSSYYSYFAEAAEKAMLIAQFAPTPNHGSRTWMRCQRVDFRVKIDLEREDLRNALPIVRDPTARSGDLR